MEKGFVTENGRRFKKELTKEDKIKNLKELEKAVTKGIENDAKKNNMTEKTVKEEIERAKGDIADKLKEVK